MFDSIMSQIVAAKTTDTISKIRISVADHAAAGRLPAPVAKIMEDAARVKAEQIAVQGERPTPTQATADDRLPAVIREAMAAEYPESGPIVRGVVAVQTDDGEQLVRFRIKRSWDGSIAALFGAAGLSPDDDPGQLVGAAVAVTLGTYESKNGPMPVVKKWHKPAAPAKATPAKPAVPEWQADDEAAPKVVRRTAAGKAKAAVREANPDDDGMVF